MTNTEKLTNLLKDSKRVLVTSHISPDPDAVSSVLLMGRTLETNFPGKDIRMALEERPNRDISFLEGYNDIHFGSLLKEARAFKPDLFVILDAMNFARVARTEGEELKALAKDLGSKLVIIDHHTAAGLEESDVYINDGLAATALQLYICLFEDLGLKKPAGFAETTLIGILTDTARHKYDDPHHRDTYRVVSELLDAGASIEKLENRLERYTKPEMIALANLANNITDSGKGYSYTFISDELTAKDYDRDAFKMACEIFTSQFVRNFEGNDWGFIIYPELLNGQKTYSVSFRSISGGVDVAALAAKLGGGGHKQAAGAKNITGDSVEAAIKTVESTIEASV